MTTPNVSIGLPSEALPQAAEIFLHAFRRKFHTLFGTDARTLAVLRDDLVTAQIAQATVDGRLAGVAGFNTTGHSALHFRGETLRRHFGWLGGTMRHLFVGALARRQQPGELYIDAIAVHPDMRGKGIGGVLIHALADVARARGCAHLSLDVVDTNPDAQRLYERIGFVPVAVHRYPFLARMGFTASVEMRWTLAG